MALSLLSRAAAGLSLTNTLPQSQTNGGSLLGTLNATTLPPFLSSPPFAGQFPWGNRTVAGSNPTHDMPDTCVTRYYDFSISRATLAPDGVSVGVIVVNGQFPGPLIEANWGDWIEVNVHNAIAAPEEGTLIHWHGLNQIGTPWYDGTPTVGQCPIPPGSNMTYRFRADEYGSSWYHSHYSAQYAAGVLGPMVIYGPTHYTYDVDLGPVLLQEWYHEAWEDIVAAVVQPNPPSSDAIRPHSDANLVQGKGYYPCANVDAGAACGNAALAEFQFTAGKQHKLRLVNTGNEAFLQVSIDNHSMTVVANDYVPIQPYTTNVVTLGVGQRADVLVEGTGQAGQAYWFRSWDHPLCGDTSNSDGRGVIFYPGADTTQLPTTTGWPLPADNTCANDPLSDTVPVYAIPAAMPDITFNVTMTFQPNSTGTFLWEMNGRGYEGDFNEPILLNATTGQTVFEPSRNVYNLGENTTVRLIFINTFLSAHPMHIHGHDFQILAEGFGEWDGTITNPQNPMRRDVHQSWAGSNSSDHTAPTQAYTIFQWTQDNPGVWPFHCHIAWHLSAGMNILLLEKPNEVAQLQVPQDIYDTCNAFVTWEQTHVVDQVDDGI